MANRDTQTADRTYNDEPLITAKELAQRLNIDQTSVRKLRDAGTIKPVPLGKGRYLYSQVREQLKQSAQ